MFLERWGEDKEQTSVYSSNALDLLLNIYVRTPSHLNNFQQNMDYYQLQHSQAITNRHEMIS